MTSRTSRRALLGGALISTLAYATGVSNTGSSAEEPEYEKSADFKGNIRQSVTRGTFGRLPIDVVCAKCKKIGLVGLDLVRVDDWAKVAQNGMTVTMGSLPKLEGAPFSLSIDKNINRQEHHEVAIALFKKYIPIAAELKVANLITLSGTRGGMDDETGLKNCALALKKIMPIAEQYKMTICMELLNEKDHKDYMCSHTAWGVELCRRVGSERFKLLYDIYHMQRMEGELINTITKNIEYIGHFHTAGNPGRRDLDDQQEIYYPPIMKAILSTGYKGYVAHEFRPKKGFESLYNAVKVCDV